MNAFGVRSRGIRDSRRGQSLVELAATLPLVMVLMMGTIDFGWVLYAHIQVAAASYEGARAGALYLGNWQAASYTDNDTARTTVVKNAIYNSTTGTSALGMLDPTNSQNFNVATDVAVGYPPTPNNIARQGQEMTVKVTYHQPVWFSLLPGISPTGRIDVSTTTKVRIQ